MTPTTTRSRSPVLWLAAGLLLLAYAALGNWLVLPGYRRFLAHSHADGSAGTSDLAFIWGAARTILWMLSFHLGAFCVTCGALGASGATRTFRRAFVIGALAWIGLWAIPSLPGPFPSAFAAVGILILIMIGLAFGCSTLTGEPFGGSRAGPWLITSAFFFALATWDICGLGSVGGILHPDSATRLASQSLVVTQTSKLIIELALAWTLLAIGPMVARRGAS